MLNTLLSEIHSALAESGRALLACVSQKAVRSIAYDLRRPFRDSNSNDLVRVDSA